MSQPEIYLDRSGWIFVDGYRLPFRLLPGGILEFHDKDRRSASARGSDKVTIPLEPLFDTLKTLQGDK